MADDDPIQEFIGLPHDQQMQTLQQLSPDKQDKLLEQIKQRKAAATTPPAGGPEARTAKNYFTEGYHAVGRGLLNVAEGLVGPEIQAAQNIAHPVQAARDMQAQATASGNAIRDTFNNAPGTFRQRDAATELSVLENLPMVGGLVQYAEKGGDRMASPEGVGAAIEGITTVAAPELAESAARALARTTRSVAIGVRQDRAANTRSARPTRRGA